MNLIILTREQAELAAYRFQAHANSAGGLTRHFRRTQDGERIGVGRAIRRVERRFGINLGTVCFKFLEKEIRPTSTFQQQVMDYVAYWRDHADGSRDLVVSVDRARQIDRLAQGQAEWLTAHDS
jgi:hypothetical protein